MCVGRALGYIDNYITHFFEIDSSIFVLTRLNSLKYIVFWVTMICFDISVVSNP